MKTTYHRASKASIGLALACALGLSACGGGDEIFPDQIVVVNLQNVTEAGLKLKLNGGTPVSVPAGNRFLFTTQPVKANSAFNVELVSNTPADLPTNAVSCEVLRGSGNVGISPPQDILVTCKLITYKLGGTITGPVPAELVINNGSSTRTIKPGDTTFELDPVPGNVPYSLTILKQTVPEKCAISQARPAAPPLEAYAAPIGLMPKQDLLNLNITCAP
jgi:hypothetical protein